MGKVWVKFKVERNLMVGRENNMKFKWDVFYKSRMDVNYNVWKWDNVVGGWDFKLKVGYFYI